MSVEQQPRSVLQEQSSTFAKKLEKDTWALFAFQEPTLLAEPIQIENGQGTLCHWSLYVETRRGNPFVAVAVEPVNSRTYENISSVYNLHDLLQQPDGYALFDQGHLLKDFPNYDSFQSHIADMALDPNFMQTA